MPGDEKPFVHPYVPNSAPQVREEMLKAIGVDDVGTLYQEVPQSLRLGRPLNLPQPIVSEHALKKHVAGLLLKNKTCNDYINFLGAGCWQHYVPSVVDEIVSRGEFLTSYGGGSYSDHGKDQAHFEYASMICELLDMDQASVTTYDWSSAISSTILMANRLTDRYEALVPKNLDPQKRAQMNNFCRSTIAIKEIDFDPKTGLMDLDDLRAKISEKTGAVYFENPTYLGVIEAQAAEITSVAHANGALAVAGVDPISLGLLEAPGRYGADIACGEVQPLGVHMNFGGGLAGLIAFKDGPRYLAECPALLVHIGPTVKEDEVGFAWANWDRTSWVQRELSRDFTGTTTGLWMIAAAVYMALMGPQGLREVGETIMSKAHYAIKRLGEVAGVKTNVFAGVPFKEFVVSFDGTGKSVAEINKALLAKGIFGGKDISAEFPAFGQSALYCVTEVVSKEDVDTLVEALQEVVR
jgi:glycine dehydrogenase subunit 1